MLKNINIWWMELDPAVQYIYWIITFCAMVCGGITSLLLMEVAYPTGLTTISLAVSGIVAFMGFFTFVVLFLAVIWPHYYNKVDKK